MRNFQRFTVVLVCLAAGCAWGQPVNRKTGAYSFALTVTNQPAAYATLQVTVQNYPTTNATINYLVQFATSPVGNQLSIGAAIPNSATNLYEALTNKLAALATVSMSSPTTIVAVANANLLLSAAPSAGWASVTATNTSTANFLTFSDGSIQSTSATNTATVSSNGIVTLVKGALGATATPTITLSGAAGSQTVAISDSSPGTVIYFSTNGVAATTSSTVYSGSYNWNLPGTNSAIATQPLLGTSSAATLTTLTVYFGCGSSGSTLTAGQIQALATTQQETGFGGNYSFTPSGSQYLYFWWPSAFGIPSAIPNGFVYNGFPLPLAGSGSGFTSSVNGWNYYAISVGGVSGYLFCSANPFNIAATVTVK